MYCSVLECVTFPSLVQRIWVPPPSQSLSCPPKLPSLRPVRKTVDIYIYLFFFFVQKLWQNVHNISSITYRSLTQFFIRVHESSLLSPGHENLTVGDNNADQVRLTTKEMQGTIINIRTLFLNVFGSFVCKCFWNVLFIVKHIELPWI